MGALRRIKLGDLAIGGGAPVMVQSMTNANPYDPEAVLFQIGRLAARGCEACRVAVPDMEACGHLGQIVAGAKMPVIGDIHFDWRLAVAALEAGCAGIRINPGNIGSSANLARIVACAKAHGAVIRIGVNSGSLEKQLLGEYGRPAPQALAESALKYARIFEKLGFNNLKLSLKSSSATDTVAAYRYAAKLCDYPLHLGVTEAGPGLRGAVKSAVGIGLLLAEGIGDTIRVSLTAPPEEEVTAAWEILRALGLRRHGPEIISCPTCGRTEIGLFDMVGQVEKALQDSDADIKVAVMGCPVNGPGEAREADIGLAGGRGKGVIFRKGEIVAATRGQENLLAAFMRELEKLLAERKAKTQAGVPDAL